MASYDAYDPYEGATQFQSNQQNQPTQQPIEAETPDKSLSNDQRKAIIAAGVGTAALGGAAYGLSMLEDSENHDLADGEGDGDGSNDLKNSLADASHITPPPVTPPTPQPPVDPFAGLTGFDKAFHEARLAMGPGHTFQYEGGTYNTYTKEEEAGLSPEERDAFLASNNLGPSGHGHHHDPSVSVASADHDHLPDVTLDPDAPGDHHSRFASNEASVSLDDDASVSLDTDHDQALHHIHMQDHTTDPVATLDDHYDTTHDLHDPAHDFDNHADVSDFT